MSKPISLPNVGGLTLQQQQQYQQQQQHQNSIGSTSPHDQFSPPRHHYPIVGSPVEASGTSLTNGFAAAHQQSRRNVDSASSAVDTFSPTGSSFSKSPRERARSMSQTLQPKVLTPFIPKNDVPKEEQDEEELATRETKLIPKVLLLENVNETAIAMFRAQGYQVDTEKGSLAEDELISRLVGGGYSAIGIRSKTKMTAKVIESVKSVSKYYLHTFIISVQLLMCYYQLIVIGCFCIGTNQVDLLAAARAGVAVFNSPFAK